MNLLQTTVPWWGTAKCWWAGGDGGFTDAHHRGSFRSLQFYVGTKIFTILFCLQWSGEASALVEEDECPTAVNGVWTSLHWPKWSFIHIPQGNLILLWISLFSGWLLREGSCHLLLVCTLLFIEGKFEHFRGFRQTHSFCPSSWNLSFCDQRWKVQISVWDPGNHVSISKMNTAPVQPMSMTWLLLELQANISSADLRVLRFDSWLCLRQCLTSPASAAQSRENLKSDRWVIQSNLKPDWATA